MTRPATNVNVRLICRRGPLEWSREMSNWNTGAYMHCRGCGKRLTRDEPAMFVYNRGAYHVRCDPTRRPNINAGLRIAISDPAPCTGTGSGGCDCLPDEED